MQISRKILFALLPVGLMVAGAVSADETKPVAKKFELRDGDRVVFLGGTNIERMQRYGYFEAMLTAAFPERKITFRNLAWAGDTVWAESRGIFDSPQKGYERLLAHVKKIEPTVIFLGYGRNEAFDGKNKLTAFKTQYQKLIADLKSVSSKDVRFVFLQPLPHEATTAIHNSKDFKDNLKQYQQVITELSQNEQDATFNFNNFLAFVNQLRDSKESVKTLTDNGVHLNAYGHSRYAMTFGTKLLDWDGTAALVVAKDGSLHTHHLQAAALEPLKFKISLDRLPVDDTMLLAFGMLPPGKSTLWVNGKVIKTTTNEDWDSISLTNLPPLEQFEQLRQAIIEKNRAYFLKWRPQNITYLTGFRKHEQGQNAAELAQFDKLVAEWETKIDALKKPQSHILELRLEKN